MQIDPKQFGLPPKTIVIQLGKNHFAVVVDRKSRVIMSDGKKLLEKVRMIQQHQPKAHITLKIKAPLCSKTKKFLEDQGITVQ